MKAESEAAEDVPPAELAQDALRLAHSDPARAGTLAHRALVSAGDDALVRSIAHEALGVAAQERQDLGAAVDQLRRAVEIADGSSLPVQAAKARTSLCHALLAHGDPKEALREADRAAEVLHGTDAVRLLMRRALVLQRLGRLDEALAAYDHALPLLQRARDRGWEARVLSNRGVLYAYRLEFEAADRDLLRAEALYDDLGLTLSKAQVRHNLGFVASRRGDVPGALRSFDAAAQHYDSLGMTDLVGLADRCELLLSARLLREAVEVATRAVSALARAGMESDLAEARLTLANAHLLSGDLGGARRVAHQARDDFERQGRPAWAVLARYLIVQVDWRAGVSSPELLERAREVASQLSTSGWLTAAIDARLVAARTALQLGDVGAAERELIAPPGVGSGGPIELRVRALHCEALLRLAHGNRRGADAALRAGMRMLERHRATLGATELRVHVSGHVSELATLGARLAIQAGSARRALLWAERWRAGALALRPVSPPDDDELLRDLAALRDTVSQLNTAALSGIDTTLLLRRQAALERSIQQRSRHASGLAEGRAPELSPNALAAALGDRVLIEMVRIDDELWAVVVADGRFRLRRLGSHSEAVTELDHLRFALRRLALSTGSSTRRRTVESLAYSAAALDEGLLGPLRPRLADRPLVIVPTGALHAVPWRLLPSCERRPVSVVPSAQQWLRADGRTKDAAGPGGVALVGCGSPPHAIAEVRVLQEQYPSATTLLGDGATIEAVLDALEGSVLAHLACHGHFRSDNPLFSCLELADGPLTVHDLERRERMPATLLLSACESGLSDVRPGDELMGLSSALFALGTSSLIASVAPVKDAATQRLMIRFHAELSRGRRPAAALAQAAALAESDEDRLVAASFVCFGAG